MKLVGFVLGSVLVVSLAGALGAAPARNNCGCYKDGATCFCDKKAKCGCPGDCEPKGCEEKRSAQMKKEVDAETKKAAEADKKHKAASGETKTASMRESNNGDNGKPGKAAPAGPKMPAAQVKQLGKLLDSYLKSNPDARSKNAEELRNELTLTPR